MFLLFLSIISKNKVARSYHYIHVSHSKDKNREIRVIRGLYQNQFVKIWPVEEKYLSLRPDNMIHDMDNKNYHIDSDNTSIAAEPTATYGVRANNTLSVVARPDEAHPNRMSIEAYFDVVWNSYLKKYDAH